MTSSTSVNLVRGCIERACGRTVSDSASNSGNAPALRGGALVNDQRFRDQGIDSLMAVRIVDELSKELGRPLRSTLLWEYPTVRSLAAFLDQEPRAPDSPRELGGARRTGGAANEPIALVGMGCRFPGGIDSSAALWQALASGQDAVAELPESRRDSGPQLRDESGQTILQQGAFLDDVAQFDASFFGISPKEAAQMDPQQRLALEIAWEALEDARVVPETLKESRTGVFFGAWTQDYGNLAAADPELVAQHSAVGWNNSIIPARIAYALGLRGPVLLINTACSSSLVALHLAVQSLHRGESDLALVGGTNLILSASVTLQMGKLGAMSPSARCHAFDAGADGYVRGEGCGVVVLRRLSDALARGDRIYAVVRGSAVNSDGASNGLTAPNPAAQVSVLREAWDHAGVEPAAVSFVETHGTGTLLGDPIEAGALGEVFGPGREHDLLIGSIKTNFGHLEAAAGIAGLLKASLALFHGQLPQNLHFASPSPHIPFRELGLRVLDTRRAWPDVPRRFAGVSSFGYGGTNAHVALEEAPFARRVVLPLAAESEPALAALAAQLGASLAGAQGDDDLRAKMVQHGQGPVRAVVRGRGPGALRAALEALGTGASALAAVAHGDPPQCVFVFSGHGSQWPGMARDLLATEPTFGQALARCSAAIEAASGWSVLDALWANDEASRLGRTEVVQPVLFAIQVALARTLQAWGVQPDAVVGQSIGEVAAAVVSGALSLEDGARLIVRWSSLVAERVCGRGGMLVAALPAEQAARYVAIAPGALDVAGHLAPNSVSFAGTSEALERLQAALVEQGIAVQRVAIDYACHGASMADAAAELVARLADLAPRPPRIPMWSTADRGFVQGCALDAAYWARNLRQPIDLQGAIEALCERASVFIEIAPHPVALRSIATCLAAKPSGSQAVATLWRRESCWDGLEELVATLWQRGVAVDWDAFAGRSQSAGTAVGAVVSVGHAPLLLSGKDEAALRAQAQRWARWLEHEPSLHWPDLLRTAALHRTHFAARAAVQVNGKQAAIEALGALAEGRAHPALARAQATARGRLVFVFPGQGSQWPQMGRALLAESPVFAQAIAACERALWPHTGWSLTKVLEGATGDDVPPLSRVDVVQPALFAMGVGLAAVWRELGVEPDAVVGHSQGEVAAAVVAGALSLEDGARVVALRSKLLLRISGRGGMAVVELAVDEVERRLQQERGLGIAAVNSARSTLVSGDDAAIDAFVTRLSAQGVFCRRVDVDYASHSSHVDAILDDLRAVLAGITPRAGRVPMVSTVTGELIDGAALDADYFCRNLRQPVRMDRALADLLDREHDVLVEVSAHPVLAMSLASTCSERGALFVGSLNRGAGGLASLLRNLGVLHAHGHPVRWDAIFGHGAPLALSPPSYAFQRQRHWLPARAATPGVEAAGLAAAHHPWLPARTDLADSQATLLTGRFRLCDHPWLADHTVFDTVLVPGTGLLELALAAGERVGSPVVRELTLAAPLALSADASVRIQLQVKASDAEGKRAFSLYGRAESAPEQAPWTLHAEGVLAADAAVPASSRTFASWPPEGAEAIELHAAYPQLRARGYGYGPAFQGLRALWRLGDALYAHVQLPEPAGSNAEFAVHPALLDSVLHAILVAGGLAADTVLLPFSWEDVILCAKGARELRVRIALGPLRAGGEARASLHAFDAAGEPVVSIAALRMREASADHVRSAVRGAAPELELYSVQWQPLALAEAEAPGATVVVGGDGALAARLGLPHLADCAALRGVARTQPAPARVMIDMTGQRPAESDLVGALHAASVHAMSELQTLLADARLVGTAAVWITSGAIAAGPHDVVADLAHAPAWGLLRTARNEQLDRVLRLVDIDAPATAPVQLLWSAIVADGEPELVVRHGVACAPRLQRADSAADALRTSPDARDYRLELPARGSLARVALAAFEPAAPPPGHVRVQVRAAGVNFRDVLNTLGMVPAPWLGLELAGIVSALGPGVQGLGLGDRVMGLGEACFASSALADARKLVVVPRALPLADAATVPLVFLTALHGLVDLAQLRAGQRVLVHAAAGGVGMAAVQLAQLLGAEVFATASPSKWSTLIALGVPAERIASSRDLQFAERFLAVTDGQGVDVVLNALAGEFVDASLRLLPRGGAFVEMGKTDLRDPGALAASHPGVEYRPFDLLELAPERAQALLQQLAAWLEAGALRPLPFTAHDLRQAPGVFQHMANGRHAGKLVLQPARELDRSGTVLVTGGLGELGRVLCHHLVTTHGVRHLAITSRRGLETEGAAELVAGLERAGAHSVVVAACDVSERAEVARVLAAIPADRPLTGVFHLAGVLDDGVVTQLTPERLARVLAPKLDGALHLHALTERLDLSAFVLFSSVIGVTGGPGQANYAAANSGLDALAALRRRCGLPGLSLCWGLWEQQGTGMTAHLGQVELARMRLRGMLPLTPAQGLQLMDQALGRSEAALVPARFDLAALQARLADGATPPALFRALLRPGLRRAVSANASARPESASLRERMLALPGKQRFDALLRFVQEEAAAVLGVAGARAVPADSPLKSLGLDSLMAVELRNRLSARAQHTLPTTLAFDYPTPHAIAQLLAERVLGEAAATAVPADGGSAPAPRTDADSKADQDADLDVMDVDELIARAMAG